MTDTSALANIPLRLIVNIIVIIDFVVVLYIKFVWIRMLETLPTIFFF